MRTGTGATSRCKGWLWAALVVASTTAALARRVHDAAGGGESTLPAAWVGARRGRVPLQTKLVTPSYFKGNGRAKVLTSLNGLSYQENNTLITNFFVHCFYEFEIAYVVRASRAVSISKLVFPTLWHGYVEERWEEGVDEYGGPIVNSRTWSAPCNRGYVVDKYNPVLSDLQLPPKGAWQCNAGLPQPFKTTPVQWTGSQPQCASSDGFNCAKPASCLKLLADLRKRTVVTPLACGAHYLSVSGSDGYNSQDTWCSVVRRILAPSPDKLPLVGSWQCLDGLPGLLINTPVRWVGFQPQCDSLDGKICNKLATRAACEARVEKLRAAVTPLLCGPYHQSVWGVNGYEKTNSWCSVARKLLAPEEAEVFPVSVKWDLDSGNSKWKHAELTMWLVRARNASVLQGFFTFLAKPPKTVPRDEVLPFQVTSGSVLGYAVPPSYYGGKGHIRATSTVTTFDGLPWDCMDNLQIEYSADSRGKFTYNNIRSLHKVDTQFEWCHGHYDPLHEELHPSHWSKLGGHCSIEDPSYDNEQERFNKISTYNSSIELLPLLVAFEYNWHCGWGSQCHELVLWLVREKGSKKLQGFKGSIVHGTLLCDKVSVKPPRVIPRESLFSFQVMKGSVFGFKA